jgi:hypothetical protein
LGCVTVKSLASAPVIVTGLIPESVRVPVAPAASPIVNVRVRVMLASEGASKKSVLFASDVAPLNAIFCEFPVTVIAAAVNIIRGSRPSITLETDRQILRLRDFPESIRESIPEPTAEPKRIASIWINLYREMLNVTAIDRFGSDPYPGPVGTHRLHVR